MKFIFGASSAKDVWNWQEVALSKRQYGKNWLANWPLSYSIGIFVLKLKGKKQLF